MFQDQDFLDPINYFKWLKMCINEEKRLLKKICYNLRINRIDKKFVIFDPIFGLFYKYNSI